MKCLIIGQVRFATAKTKATLYQILEVGKSASIESIRKNYLKLAKIYHPDVYKGSQKDRFSLINEAYAILSDKLKRSEYDRSLNDKKETGERGNDSNNKADSRSQQSFRKHDNPMNYEQKIEQIDLDAQYQKFMKRPNNTRFQQIYLHENNQFKGMTEQQRIRRRFTEVYQDDSQFIENKFKKSFQQVLDDQIDQRNQHLKQQKQKAERIKSFITPKAIRTQKILIFISTTIIGLIMLPLTISFYTKYRLQAQAMRITLETVNKIQQRAEQAYIRSRFRY